jgi:hypothetical protein
VTPPAEVADWIEKILGLVWKNPKPVVEMISQLCRKTGDPLRDIPPQTIAKVVQRIADTGDFTEPLTRITQRSPRKQKEENAIFGEALPAGLMLEKGTDP